MAELIRKHTTVPVQEIKQVDARERAQQPDLAGARQAFAILRLAFTIIPIVAGLDKFFHLLVNWDNYVAPIVTQTLGVGNHRFMLVAGAIEVIAGIGVAVKPKVFSYIVAAWLVGIIINLLITGHYFDIALRDFGLFLGAFALARLSRSS